MVDAEISSGGVASPYATFPMPATDDSSVGIDCLADITFDERLVGRELFRCHQ